MFISIFDCLLFFNKTCLVFCLLSNSTFILPGDVNKNDIKLKIKVANAESTASLVLSVTNIFSKEIKGIFSTNLVKLNPNI